MRRGMAVLMPHEYGEITPEHLVVHEACGIKWDQLDVYRFLLKCDWQSREVLERDNDGNIHKVTRRCLIWQGAKSRGGPHRAAGRKAGNKKWYGSFSVKGKTVRAHKFAAVALHGLRPGPDDEIDHNCYDTLCVFCLECVPKAVNQARIRRGKGDAERPVEPESRQREALEPSCHKPNGSSQRGFPPGHQPGGGTPCR